MPRGKKPHEHSVGSSAEGRNFAQYAPVKLWSVRRQFMRANVVMESLPNWHMMELARVGLNMWVVSWCKKLWPQ